jgi:hypothetical protein
VTNLAALHYNGSGGVWRRRWSGTMRGYLTRTGLGMLLGAVVMCGALLGVVDLSARRTAPLDLTRTAGGPAQLGPFRVEIERFVLARTPGGRTQALVQLHLWRPDGPVPVAQRVPVAGVARLDGPWQSAGDTWLIRNEWMQVPLGESLDVTGLGAVPATHHAGEARAVLRFDYLGSQRRPGYHGDLHFELPGGAAVDFAGLTAEGR